MRRLLPLLLLVLMPAIAGAQNRYTIEEDVRVAAGETVGTAASLLGSVYVDGEVTGTAISVFGDVSIGPEGQVRGDAVSVGGSVFQVEGSTVSGTTRSVGVPGGSAGKWLLMGIPVAIATAAAIGMATLIASGFGFLILIGLILVFFERQVVFARETIDRTFVRCFGYGLLAFFGLVPLVIFLAVTIIGIPVAVAVGVIAFAALSLGAVAACEWTGRKAGERFGKEFGTPAATFVGLGLLFALGFVPLLGTVVHIVALFAGLGAVIQTRFRAAQTPR